MNLLDIARLYTDIVKVDDEIPDSDHETKDDVSTLRGKYHRMLMKKLKENGIKFADRFEAMAIAFELVNQEKLVRGGHPAA